MFCVQFSFCFDVVKHLKLRLHYIALRVNDRFNLVLQIGIYSVHYRKSYVCSEKLQHHEAQGIFTFFWGGLVFFGFVVFVCLFGLFVCLGFFGGVFFGSGRA